jgi:uncharacterized protein (DUF58 family)
MNSSKPWFSLRKSEDVPREADLVPGALNPATWQRIEDLVAMQRHAPALSPKQVGSARARLAGSHLSRFRGRGMDYQESRAYQAGDDVRHMDWRVTARTGTAQIKLYQEERERPVLLFLDLHPGMFFGTRGLLKSAAAARAGALIAWAAVERGDRVGAVLTNGARCELPPRGGRQGALQFIRHVVAHTDPRTAIDAANSPASLNDGLARLCRVSRPGSQIFLLGDFAGIDDESDHFIHRLRRHCDVAALQIVDPLELSPPPPARYGIAIGAERGVLDLRSRAARRAYQAHFDRHHRAVDDLMRRHGVPLARLSTDQDLVQQVRRILVGGVAHAILERLAA